MTGNRMLPLPSRMTMARNTVLCLSVAMSVSACVGNVSGGKAPDQNGTGTKANTPPGSSGNTGTGSTGSPSLAGTGGAGPGSVMAAGGNTPGIITGTAGSGLNASPNYTIFGRIISGLAIAQKIQALPILQPNAPPNTPGAQQPKNTVYIDSVTITVK